MEDKKSLPVCSTCERLHDKDQFCPRRVAKALVVGVSFLKTPADRVAYDVFKFSKATVVGVVENFLADDFIVHEPV